FSRDWSSGVGSSDLVAVPAVEALQVRRLLGRLQVVAAAHHVFVAEGVGLGQLAAGVLLAKEEIGCGETSGLAGEMHVENGLDPLGPGHLDGRSAREHHDDPRVGPGKRLHQGHLVFGKADRKSTRLNSSHVKTSYAVFCLTKKSQ